MEIERAFEQMGLRTPTTRFAAVGGGVAGVLWLVKPTMMFDEGVARPWTLLTSRGVAGSDSPDVPPTLVPWYVAAAGAGLIAAVFV